MDQSQPSQNLLSLQTDQMHICFNYTYLVAFHSMVLLLLAARAT